MNTLPYLDFQTSSYMRQVFRRLHQAAYLRFGLVPGDWRNQSSLGSEACLKAPVPWYSVDHQIPLMQVYHS